MRVSFVWILAITNKIRFCFPWWNLFCVAYDNTWSLKFQKVTTACEIIHRGRFLISFVDESSTQKTT